MTELARGSITDRPWGRTLASIGLRGVTGQVIIGVDGKRFEVGFIDGAIVGARSPLAADAAVRIAMTSGLVSSSQVADIARRQAAAPHRDEVDIIAEAARLGPDQAMRLRRRAVAQRAARTFGIERGDFVVDDQLTVPVVPGTELDIRAVVYIGAYQNLSDTRLAADLASFGTSFRLRPEAQPDLPQFGFGNTPENVAVLGQLVGGATIEELEGLQDPRTVRAMLYALVSCGAVDVDGPRQHTGTIPAPVRASQPIPAQRPVAQAQPARPAVQAQPPRPQPPFRAQPQPAQRPVAQAQPAPAPTPPARPTPPPAEAYATSFDAPTERRVDAHPLEAPTTFYRNSEPATAPRAAARPVPAAHARPAPAPAPAARAAVPPRAAKDTSADVRTLITQRSKLLAARADHFQLLGLSSSAKPDEIRKTYFTLARQLHPDRLAALGIDDDQKTAQKLFAQINTAFAVLSDDKRRAEYLDILRRGGEAAIRAEEARAEEMAERVLEAEECYRRGEAALRRDQLAAALAEFKRAMELNPDESDYQASYAWTQFCAAPDKMAAAAGTRQALERAIGKAPRAAAPRFYLGRVERMLGRDKDALRHFQEVLQIMPHHTEAASEVRVLEQRLAGPNARKR